MNNDMMLKTVESGAETVAANSKIPDIQGETVVVKTVEIVNTDSVDRVYERKKHHISIYDVTKRLLDVVLSLFALIVLSPIFIVISTLVKIEDLQKPKSSKGTVFFLQYRPGYKGKQIKVHKFRSMVANAEELIAQFTPDQKKEYEENFKLENDPRITKVGKFLRRSSLDELPQLWDILIGNLSVVGPRPATSIDEIYTKYGDRSEKFLSVKPGLTGYWQVNGRSDTTYDERVELELYYVDNKSFWLDIKIMFKTIGVVLKGKGSR